MTARHSASQLRPIPSRPTRTEPKGPGKDVTAKRAMGRVRFGCRAMPCRAQRASAPHLEVVPSIIEHLNLSQHLDLDPNVLQSLPRIHTHFHRPRHRLRECEVGTWVGRIVWCSTLRMGQSSSQGAHLCAGVYRLLCCGGPTADLFRWPLAMETDRDSIGRLRAAEREH